jgi:tetratricopeptide (TPR) repeat protein
MGRKTGLLLNGYEIPLNYNYDFFRSRSVFFSLPWPGFALVFSLAASGLFLSFCNRRTPWPAVLFLAAVALGTVLFFVTSRYRMPLVPPLLLLAGYGAGEGLGSLLSARLSRFALAAAVAAAAAVPALFPVERVDFSGAWRGLGDANRKEGRWVEALKAYDRSLAVRPGSAAWNNKGAVLLKFKGEQGARDAAVAFEEAIHLDEGNREAWNNLGVARKSEGDALAAEDAFERAIARFPGYVKPVENLARLWAEQGEQKAARELIRRLVVALEGGGEGAQAEAVRKRWRLEGR